jgi:hypothetical protein
VLFLRESSIESFCPTSLLGLVDELLVLTPEFFTSLVPLLEEGPLDAHRA